MDLRNNWQFPKAILYQIVSSYFSNNPIFKGVRHIVQAENSNYLRKKDVEKGIGKLSKFNLTFDLLITTEQIKSAISLVDFIK